MVPRCIVVCLALLAAASATEVQQCKGFSLENLQENVQLHPCKKIPCTLKKGTNENISISFNLAKDTKNMINQVSANVLGVDLPFVGVDGNSICDKIFTASGEPAPCPLKANTPYTYKDSFPILSFYPSISVVVKWALIDNDDGKKNEIHCFQVAARIK